MGCCISKKNEFDSAAFAANIRLHRTSLVFMIDTEHGLFDQLRRNGTLTIEQCQLVAIKTTNVGKTAQLLDAVVGMPYYMLLEEFVQALQNTQQSHVVSFICANGLRTKRHGDNWPLIGSTDELKLLDKNWPKFEELMDPRNGLLDEMLQLGCISQMQRQTIEAGKTDVKINERLLIILRRKSLADYKKFIECLVNTKQYALVSLLDQTTKVKSLSNEQVFRLGQYRTTLATILDTRNGLVAELCDAGCITQRQKEFVETDAAYRNSRLLDIVARGCQSDFDKFVEFVRRAGQLHAAEMLAGDGAVAHVVLAMNNIGADYVNKAEMDVARRLANLFNSDAGVCPNHGGKTNASAIRLITVNAYTTRGFELYYKCQSLAGLHYLFDLYSTGELKLALDKMFAMLLTGVYPQTELTVDYFVWKKTNYAICANLLCRSASLPLLSEVYDLARKTQHADAEYDRQSRSLPIDQLPFELIEILLIRTARMLYVTLNRKASRANVYALVTLSAVARLWWRTLTYRQYNKRRLRRYFSQVSRPYRHVIPEQLTSLRAGDGHDVCGVAVLNDRLYVACKATDSVHVFRISPPFGRLEDVKVKGLADACDIVACRETNRLYVADWKRAIWRVNLASDNNYSMHFVTTQCHPNSLSMKSRRPLVTSSDGDALFIYSDDRVLLNHVQLPDYMEASHAVESSRNTYIVSHGKRFVDDTQSEHDDGVSEVDTYGRIIRQFNNQLDASLQFNKPQPYYLLLNANNHHVVVANRRGKTVVLLKPDMQSKMRILIRTVQGMPQRLCLDSVAGLMFVACHSTDIVRIYKVLD